MVPPGTRRRFMHGHALMLSFLRSFAKFCTKDSKRFSATRTTAKDAFWRQTNLETLLNLRRLRSSRKGFHQLFVAHVVPAMPHRPVGLFTDVDQLAVSDFVDDSVCTPGHCPSELQHVADVVPHGIPSRMLTRTSSPVGRAKLYSVHGPEKHRKTGSNLPIILYQLIREHQKFTRLFLLLA